MLREGYNNDARSKAQEIHEAYRGKIDDQTGRRKRSRYHARPILDSENK